MSSYECVYMNLLSIRMPLLGVHARTQRSVLNILFRSEPMQCISRTDAPPPLHVHPFLMSIKYRLYIEPIDMCSLSGVL